MAELRKLKPKIVKPVISNTAFQHAGKHFDFVLGIDFHWTVTPLNWIPLPLPHPFVGVILDIMDYIHFSIPIPSFLQSAAGTTSIPMGGSVYVHGRHKATTTTSVMGVAVPWAHATGLLPVYLIVDKPMAPHEGEVYYGSPTVLAQGSEMGGNQPQHVLTCWSPPMGLTPLPTMPNKIKKNPLAYFAFYSRFLKMYVQINTSGPVLVGGTFQPHTYTIGEYLMRFAGMALMRALTKAIGKGLSKGLKTLNNRVLKSVFGESNKLSKGLCFLGLEPVNFVTGEMVFEWDDFELAGSTVLKCTNSWQSQSPFPNMFGRGVFNSLDLSIIPAEDKTFAVWKHPEELIPVHIPYMEVGEEPCYYRAQKIWVERTSPNTWVILHHQNRYIYHYFKDAELGDIYRVSSLQFSDGSQWEFTYYQGRHNILSRVTNKNGRTLHIEAHQNGKNAGKIYYQYKEEFDLLVKYDYDDSGNLTHVYDRKEKAIQFVYDSQNRVEKRINRNGLEYWWVYDEQGRVVETSGANGFQHGQIVYHPQEGYNEIFYLQTPGKAEKFYYDEAGLVDYKVDARGGETWYEHNRFNERKMEASPEGRTVGFEYDEWGNVSVYHTADGEQISYVYNAVGQLLKRTDAGGATEAWMYDDEQRLLSYTAKNKVTVKYDYNGESRLPARAADSNGFEMAWQYNAFGQPVLMANSDGMVNRWDYDHYGRLIRQTGDTGRQTHWKRDELGRIKAVYESGQHPLKVQYDAYDLPVHATDGREEWWMEYTPMGSLRRQVRQSATDKLKRGALTFYYDEYENLKAIQNEKSEVYRFIRNEKDEVIEEIGFDGQRKGYLRNRDGFVTRVTQHNGSDVFYDYDLAGRLVYTHYEDGFWESFEYDKTGLLAEAANALSTVTFTRNALGQIVKEEGEHGHSVSYQYDGQGRLQELGSTLGAKVEYSYDNVGYLEQVTARAGDGEQPWQMGWQRKERGSLQFKNYTGGVRSVMEYDPTGTPVSQQVTANGKTTLNRQYKWNKGARLASTLNVLTNERVRYDYDSFGSLISANYNEKETIFKNPDEVGNLYRTKDRSDRKYGVGGKLLKDGDWFYHYDALGNLVLKTKCITDDVVWQRGDWAYRWLANGTLQHVKRPDGSVVEFEYDALGRRTAKMADGKVNRYVWDGNLLLHEWSYDAKDRPRLVVQGDGQLVYDKKELVKNITTWVYDNNSFTPSAKLVGGKQYSIIADYLGTPVDAYDEGGNKVWYRELDCYGQVRKGDNAFVPFLYQGQYWDEETGLAYNRFRYYDNDSGNYISQDPIGLAGNNPTLYGYVYDTNKEVDIFGLEFVDPKKINFSQNNIKGTFSNGSPIKGAIDAVKANPEIAKNFDEPVRLMKLEDLPNKIQYQLKSQGAKAGDVFSLDNRRLHVAQAAGVDAINARFVTQADLAAEAKAKGEFPINLNKRFTTENAGRKIDIRCR